eukprot:2347256-Rhodomonas_salina.2
MAGSRRNQADFPRNSSTADVSRPESGGEDLRADAKRRKQCSVKRGGVSKEGPDEGSMRRRRRRRM